jgi:hypothetical protein
LTERWRIPLHLPPGTQATVGQAVPNGVILKVENWDKRQPEATELVGYFAP